MPSRRATIDGTLKIARLGRLIRDGRSARRLEARRHSRPRAAIDDNPETCRIGEVDGFENLEATATNLRWLSLLTLWELQC